MKIGKEFSIYFCVFKMPCTRADEYIQDLNILSGWELAKLTPA